MSIALPIRKVKELQLYRWTKTRVFHADLSLISKIANMLSLSWYLQQLKKTRYKLWTIYLSKRKKLNAWQFKYFDNKPIVNVNILGLLSGSNINPYG